MLNYVKIPLLLNFSSDDIRVMLVYAYSEAILAWLWLRKLLAQAKYCDSSEISLK